MMVIGFGSDGRKYVIDFIRDKLKLSERTLTILELAERWRPSVIFWEENASVEGGGTSLRYWRNGVWYNLTKNPQK